MENEKQIRLKSRVKSSELEIPSFGSLSFSLYKNLRHKKKKRRAVRERKLERQRPKEDDAQLYAVPVR